MMFAISRNKGVFSLIKNTQQAFMHRDAGTQDGAQYYRITELVAVGDAEWGDRFDGLVFQFFTDFIPYDLPDALQVATKQHRVELVDLIAQLAEVIMEDRSRMRKVVYHERAMMLYPKIVNATKPLL